MKHRSDDMLLHIAMGDAYCAAVEYVKDESLRTEAMKVEKYLRHPTHGHRPGEYTDDTQMSIAVSEVLLGEDWSVEAFADAFVRVFKRDQRKGYSRGFQGVLESVNNGTELLQTLRGHNNSTKNGAAMRAVPIGALPSVKDVIDVAGRQARITHNSIDGVDSAVYVALMSHYAMYVDQPMTSHDLYQFLDKSYDCLYEELLTPWVGPVTGPNLAMNTVRAVFTVVTRNGGEADITTMLRHIIEDGGDTDSVAAIALGIKAPRFKKSLPPFFEAGLEPAPRQYGAPYLKELGRRLMDKFNPN